MTTPWEATWASINVGFTSLAVELRATNPALWWSCGHAENEAFPFWAYASFSRSRDSGEEDVVVSLSFKDVDGRLSFTSDVALGDGQIVVDGPSADEPDDSDRTRWVEDQTAAGLEFVRTHVGMLRGLLTTSGLP